MRISIHSSGVATKQRAATMSTQSIPTAAAPAIHVYMRSSSAGCPAAACCTTCVQAWHVASSKQHTTPLMRSDATCNHHQPTQNHTLRHSCKALRHSCNAHDTRWRQVPLHAACPAPQTPHMARPNEQQPPNAGGCSPAHTHNSGRRDQARHPNPNKGNQHDAHAQAEKENAGHKQ